MFFDLGHVLLKYFRNASNLSVRRDDFSRFVDVTANFLNNSPNGYHVHKQPFLTARTITVATGKGTAPAGLT